MGRIVGAVLQRAYETHMEEMGKAENACSHVPGVYYRLLWFTSWIFVGLWIFVGFGL
jgi:hypothetical protein